VVDLVVFDFDGVMTDNTVWVLQDGTEAVRCHRGDGLGISRLRQAGFSALVLSTETNPVVSARCAKLGLPVEQGCPDKAGRLLRLLNEDHLDASRVVYLGNDLNDLGCLRLVGLPVAVADAVETVKAEVALVLDNAGGHGAVRELCELLVANSRPSHKAVRSLSPAWQIFEELGTLQQR